MGELNQSPRGRGLWKFNNSSKSNEEYLTKMKKHIASTLKNLNDKNIFDEQARWEFLKYEIRKFTKMFSKNLCQKDNIEKNSLEETLKYMEENTKKIFKQTPNILNVKASQISFMKKRLMVSKYEVNVTGMKAARNLQNFP